MLRISRLIRTAYQLFDGVDVKVRGKTVLTLLLFSALGIGGVMISRNIRERIQRHWPDLTDAAADELLAQRENAWVPVGDRLPLECESHEGAVMGRVTANSWRSKGRIYFQVRGPESPDADGFVFCEAVYSAGASRKVEQYTRDRARILWQLNGQTTAYSAVSRERYRIRREAGHVKLTLWTLERELPESLLFRYREEDQIGTISFCFPASTQDGQEESRTQL